MYKLQFKNEPSRSIWLVGEKVTLGSHPKNDVVLASLGIDDFHATIDVEVNELTLKSEPGRCYVNALPVDAQYSLQANDELKIGANILQIVESGDFICNKQKPGCTSSLNARNSKSAMDEEYCWSLIPKHKQLRNRKYLIQFETTLGRDLNCDISIPYKLLSRKHSRLTIKNGQLIVADQGSANGIFHNGKKVTEVAVSDGDTISFSNLEFLVKAPKKNGVETGSIASQDSNKTMIRSAIDVQEELEKVKAKKAGDKFLSLTPSNEYQIASQKIINASLIPKWTSYGWLSTIGLIAAFGYVSLFSLIFMFL